MPVELIAAWLLAQGCRLLVMPVVGKVRDRIASHASDRIVALLSDNLPKPISAALFGQDAERHGTDVDPGVATDMEFVEAIEHAPPEAREALGRELGQILGVKLVGDEIRRGTDGWYVSAYAAILWRIATLAVWEERPIAIQGALQGREWVTVCVPRERNPIVPSRMWRQLDPRTFRRVYNNKGPADFFVRQIKDENDRTVEVAELNDKFMIAPNVGFQPADAKSVADGWHRVDGLNRGWVLLKPDAAAEKTIKSKNAIPDGQGGLIYTRVLETRPPVEDEYPQEWRDLLKIGNESIGIAALSAGADEFARASEAAAAAVEAAFED